MEDKRNNEVHLSELQKACHTGVSLLLWQKIMAVMLCLPSRLVNVVRQLDKISSSYHFFKIKYPAIISCFKCVIRCKMDWYYSVNVIFVT